MASQVLSGSSNPTYTNNTGQNVRVIINYMRSASTQRGPSDFNETQRTTNTITLNWAGVSASASSDVTINLNSSRPGGFGAVLGGAAGPIIIGKSLGTFTLVGTGGAVSNGAISPRPDIALPLEILLAPGQTFSAVCSVYNIIVIPENG